MQRRRRQREIQETVGKAERFRRASERRTEGEFRQSERERRRRSGREWGATGRLSSLVATGKCVRLGDPTPVDI